MIEIKNIHKKYVMGASSVCALNGVSLKIQEGEFVAIMGASGSGKSTLMHVLGLLDVPTSGSYRLYKKEVANLSEDEQAEIRCDTIGFIFQQFNLLPRMSAIENVLLPQIYSYGEADIQKAESLLERVGLKDRSMHRPNELSGGQQQRVAIARALINSPKIIFADEPTGNLDSKSAGEIMDILKELNEQGITIVLVTHEDDIARKARRLIRMKDGVIQSDDVVGSSKSRRAHHDWIPAFETVSQCRGGALSPPNNAIECILWPAQRPATTLRHSLFAGMTSTKKRFLEVPIRSAFKISETLDFFKQGFKTLNSNKIRTGLSMLGILIGVAAVVAMLALGRGAQKAIEVQLSSLGSNLLVLRPGAVTMGGAVLETGAATRLTIEDVSNIKENVPSVKDASGTVLGRGQAAFSNKNWNTQVFGVGSAYATMRASVPELGRFFTDGENANRSLVAVIGTTVADELFSDVNPIGEMIKINKVNFRVIGILPEKGATSWRDQDDVVLVPLLTAMHRLFGKEYLNHIDIEAENSSELDSVQTEIMDMMVSSHKIPLSQQQDAFQVRNMADVKTALSESSRTMSLLLSSIAAISLLVGGIGIMNIMLVSVTERTREIGLRKAIGARRFDILSQFLAESVVISAVGGLLGIVIGWIIIELISFIAGWSADVSASSVILAFFFSASIGIIFGSYPARKASFLNPIDALRYE